MKLHHTVVFLSLGAAAWGLRAQSDQEIAAATVDTAEIKAHIYFLSDDLLRGRATGTDGNKIAASYLANTLRSYGVKPNPLTGTWYQSVPLLKKSPPDSLMLQIAGLEGMSMAPLESAPLEYEGEAVFLGHGLAEDYEDSNVAGKFLIVKAGNPEANTIRDAWQMREQKKALAKEHGALGILEWVQADNEMWGYVEHSFNTPQFSIRGEGAEKPEADFNYLWLRNAGGATHDDLLAGQTMAISFRSGGTSYSDIQSQNVIGFLKGTDPKLQEEYIIYSAHYDHVGVGKPDISGDSIYNGARDNAVGVTTVLSMAENLSKYPTRRSALFIMFTAEEDGLLGSQYYVDHPVIPLNQMVYCFNSDNAGYNNTGLATIVGLTRTSAEGNLRKAAAAFGLEAVEDPAPEQNLFDRSDNVRFARKGIPAPTFSMGFDAFDEEINTYYHQPGDEADSLDFQYLGRFFSAYVYSGRLLANDPNTPVWKAGDAYEAAWKALYQKGGAP